MTERVVFHVDMNAFFASVEQRYNPALRGQPIAVCGNPKTRTVVAACSYEAKHFGIKNGMSTGEARRLCPALILVAGNPSKYVDVARRMFALLRSSTPQMEVCSIDEAFLDVTQTWARVGATPETLARLIKRRIRDTLGLTCSVGIGPNKLLAKLAANLQKPDGLVHLTPETIPVWLARLPVERLCGVGPRLKATLNEWGIITCADLGAAPLALLTARYGILGSVLKRMGQGLDESPVRMAGDDEAAQSMGHCYTLLRDTAEPSVIHGTMLRLAEQVARRLRQDGAQCWTVALTIRYGDFSGLSRQQTLAQPTDQGIELYQAAQRLLARWCEPLAHRVRLVGVQASQLVRHQRQLSWLAEDSRLERLTRCIDGLADRFGEHAIVRAAALTPWVTKSHGFLLRSHPA
jgi:DNA polymerase-4